ncbi:hypothetical protein E2542_SST24095 [Spatholobus suberectus]|nr:hypothetical protein E2542_SST24095 [Spatholobus suberectus]
MVLWMVEFLSLALFSVAEVINFQISIEPCILIREWDRVLVNSDTETGRDWRMELKDLAVMLSFLQLMIILGLLHAFIPGTVVPWHTAYTSSPWFIHYHGTQHIQQIVY